MGSPVGAGVSMIEPGSHSDAPVQQGQAAPLRSESEMDVDDDSQAEPGGPRLSTINLPETGGSDVSSPSTLEEDGPDLSSSTQQASSTRKRNREGADSDNDSVDRGRQTRMIASAGSRRAQAKHRGR